MGLFDDHYKLDLTDQMLDVNLDGEVNGYDYFLIEQREKEEQERIEADRQRLEEIEREIEESRRYKEEHPFDLDTFLAENRRKSQPTKKTPEPSPPPSASGACGTCLLYLLFCLIGGGVLAAFIISLFGL